MQAKGNYKNMAELILLLLVGALCQPTGSDKKSVITNINAAI